MTPEDIDAMIAQEHAAIVEAQNRPRFTSPLAWPRHPQVVEAPAKGPVTADCYAAHTGDWCGCATPKRRPAP